MYIYCMRGRNFRDFCDRHENFFRQANLNFLLTRSWGSRACCRRAADPLTQHRVVAYIPRSTLLPMIKQSAENFFTWSSSILSFRHCNCEWARQFSNSDQHALGSLLPSILRTLKCTLSSSKISVNCRGCGPSHDRPRENLCSRKFFSLYVTQVADLKHLLTWL